MASQFVHQATSVMAEWVATVNEIASPVLNSNVVTSAIGAVAGAYFGALAAGKIADRAKRQERIEKAVEDANGAILLAVDTMSVLITLKSQHISGLVGRYKKANQDLATHREHIQAGKKPPNAEFVVELELRTLEDLSVSPDQLLRRIESMPNFPGHIYLKAGAYRRSVLQLATAISGRNKLIGDWIAGNVQAGFTKEQLYFGTPNRDRHVNEIYPSYMQTIEQAIDDGIGFSIALANALQAHAKTIREKLGKDRPTVIGVTPLIDFRSSLPDLAWYEDFGVAKTANKKIDDKAS